ncbi:hypothetical protein E8E13_009992 [Curvularia kusanoi]|uniref:Uncharacterized protein n=1 Tax=Curvularia kusanoi TaxID=90978 RepID=A0A9P4TQ09_CURKU|nr:hypothetical protein E8E13_009992 [Curvularia kusanoi]
MPSFAFWKSSKPDESKSPLLSDAAVKAELSVIIPNTSKAVDLNPGNQDAGVFLFDDDAREIPGDETPVIEQKPPMSIGPTLDSSNSLPNQHTSTTNETSDLLLDVKEPSPCSQLPALVPEAHSSVKESTASEPPSTCAETPVSKGDSETNVPQASSPTREPESEAATSTSSRTESNADEERPSPPRSQPLSLVPKEAGPILDIEKGTARRRFNTIETSMRDRDSGVYMSDSETSPNFSRPFSVACSETTPLRSRVTSLSKPATPSPQRTNSIVRLQRPAELNLGFSSPTSSPKPKSELDVRHNIIQNSKTRSKAALRSPTQLLQDRLNMTQSQRKEVEDKARVFTPPRAAVNGCLLPGPGAQAEAFTSTSVRAKTEAGHRPAWWCKVDKLVVFDGVERQGDGELRLKTRTSKGLTIARRRGDLETVVIPMDCAHCIEMLNRHEWKYDMRVCKRSVCWDCKERCKWELEQENLSAATPRADVNRERADSMLDVQSGSNLAKEITV